MHLNLKINRLFVLVSALVFAPGAFAIAHKFAWGMHLDFGSYADAYPLNEQYVSSAVSGFFVIDNQLVDLDSDPSKAVYMASALIYVTGPAGSAMTYGTFGATIGPVYQYMGLSSPAAAFVFDFSESPSTTIADISEIFDRRFSGLEGSFYSIWGDGHSDNASSVLRIGPYDPSSRPPSPVPDALGLEPLVVAFAGLALAKSMLGKCKPKSIAS